MNFKNVMKMAVPGALLLFTACSSNGSYDNPKADMANKVDSVSYAFGLQNGKFLAQQGFDDFDIQNFAAGVHQGLKNEADSLNQLSEQEANMIIQSYMTQMRQEQSEANIEAGMTFLEENLEKEGVQETASGLQYKVIEEGNGASPASTDRVRVHYKGTLTDGQVFDSSYRRGEPAEFPLNRVIPGWTEGLQLMSEGAKYEFYIPSDLGYGNNPPQGSIIKPGSVLVFEVELLEVLGE